MTTYLYKPGHAFADAKGFVTKEDFYAYKYYTEPDLRMYRGNEPVVVNYISDEMPPTRHMALPPGSKLYTSKKKFRDETRARGCIEYGNDIAPLIKPRKPIEPDRRERREAIRQVVRSYKDGSIPDDVKASSKQIADIANYSARNRVRKNFD